MINIDDRILYLNHFKENGISLNMDDWDNLLNNFFKELIEERGDNNRWPSYLIFYSIGSVKYFGYNLIKNHMYNCGRINFCEYTTIEEQTRIFVMIKRLMKETFDHEVETVDLKK